MSIEKKEIKQNITFRGLAKSAVDTISLYHSSGESLKPTRLIGLTWMKSVFPERFSNEQLMVDPNLEFFNNLIWLGMEVNDAVDIIPQARKEGKQEIVESIFGEWKEAMRATRAGADLTPETAQIKRQHVKNYQREVLFCERTFRELPKDILSLDKILNYREMVNAITIVNNASALLGDETLHTRLTTINKKDLSWGTLEKKYYWIISGRQQNNVEERLNIMFNLMMAFQTLDDWYDIEDDTKLGLDTIATQVLKEEGSAKGAKKRIINISDYYFMKAEDLGTTRNTITGTKQLFTILKTFLKKYPQLAGTRERFLNGRVQSELQLLG